MTAATPPVTGTLSIVPYITGTVSLFGTAAAVAAPAITTPPSGIAQLYYNSLSAYVFTLAGVTDASGLVLDNSNAKVYAKVTNQVTGASYLAVNAAGSPFGAMITGTAVNTVPGTALPAAYPPLLAAAYVYDLGTPGAGGVLYNVFEAILIPQPPQSLLYKRGGTNKIIVSSLRTNAGVAQTDANSFVYVTITDAYTGATVLGSTPLVYSFGTGQWSYSGIDLSGVVEPALLLTLTVYAANGVTVNATWTYRGYRG